VRPLVIRPPSVTPTFGKGHFLTTYGIEDDPEAGLFRSIVYDTDAQQGSDARTFGEAQWSPYVPPDATQSIAIVRLEQRPGHTSWIHMLIGPFRRNAGSCTGRRLRLALERFVTLIR
jgi:hypothetical protein